MVYNLLFLPTDMYLLPVFANKKASVLRVLFLLRGSFSLTFDGLKLRKLVFASQGLSGYETVRRTVSLNALV